MIVAQVFVFGIKAITFLRIRFMKDTSCLQFNIWGYVDFTNSFGPQNFIVVLLWILKITHLTNVYWLKEVPSVIFLDVFIMSGDIRSYAFFNGSSPRTIIYCMTISRIIPHLLHSIRLKLLLIMIDCLELLRTIHVPPDCTDVDGEAYFLLGSISWAGFVFEH